MMKVAAYDSRIGQLANGEYYAFPEGYDAPEVRGSFEEVLAVMDRVAAEMNALTVAITAFNSWPDFEKSMVKDGYVPTIRLYGGRLKEDKARDAKAIELRSKLVARGYRVFPEQI